MKKVFELCAVFVTILKMVAEFFLHEVNLVSGAMFHSLANPQLYLYRFT